MKEASCLYIAGGENTVRDCTNEEHFEIQPDKKDVSSNSPESVQMYRVSSKRIHEQESGQITLERTKSPVPVEACE